LANEPVFFRHVLIRAYKSLQIKDLQGISKYLCLQLSEVIIIITFTKHARKLHEMRFRVTPHSIFPM